MMFLASFLVAFGATVLFERSQKTCPTIAVFCVPVILVSLLLLLVSAPWQIKLAVLVLVLLSYRFVHPELTK